VCHLYLFLSPLLKFYFPALVLRLLYRLQTLSEQATFDAATFSYIFPLLKKVLFSGGIQAADEDQALEQVSLALGVIKSHCGGCAFCAEVLEVIALITTRS
jgi:hypothetical protein